MIPKIRVVGMLAVVALGLALPLAALVKHPAAAKPSNFYQLLQVRVANANPTAYLWEVRQTFGTNNSETEPP